MTDTIPHLTEFETKYRVEPHLLTEFKGIVGQLPNLKKFLYVEGPDYYFTTDVCEKFTNFANTLKKDDKDKMLSLIDGTLALLPSFIRFRRPSHGLDDGRSEVTTKYKKSGSKNNIQRKETNIRVDKTPEESIKDYIDNFLYKKNFSIWKGCHIYNLDDATLVFYSVFDTTEGKPSKTDTFVEIEVDEELVTTLTEAEAMAIITKYEKILEPIGLSAQRRLRKSLYELYVRE